MRFLILLFALGGVLSAGEPPKRGVAEHVVLIAWDGMRPDFVSKANTPVLWKLAKEGVFFARHHPVYPSVTHVNVATLATGLLPEHSGIIGNREFRPDIAPYTTVGTQMLDVIRAGDKLSAGKYLAAPTIVEIVQHAGLGTAVAGTKPAVLLFDRADRTGNEFVAISEGKSLPESVLLDSGMALGKFPEQVAFPNSAQDDWTVNALLDMQWKEKIPALSVVWLSDPDFTQHHHAPGSPEALAAMRNNDRILGRILAELDKRGARKSTDILIVSDHGFSTVGKTVEVEAALLAAGFRAFQTYPEEPQTGDILVAPNGGSAFLYVHDHDWETTRKAVEFLQHSDFAGVIFTKEKYPGTFSMGEAKMASRGAPDIVVSFAWSDGKNKFGTPGLVFSTGLKPGQGMHGSLSRFDMHNTLVASGPDFKKGLSSEIPSGNLDVAPTILWLLGLKAPRPMDGRILTEALTGPDARTPRPKTERITAEADLLDGVWSQDLIRSRVGRSLYFDQGNGAFLKK